jgi:hypothetical protein
MGQAGIAVITGSLLLAVLSTTYDFVWATWISRHRAIYGLVHGTTLLSAIGLMLGWHAQRPVTGVVGGAIAGLIAAASFYAMAPMLGMSAMFPSWMLLWVLFAALDAYLNRRPIVAWTTIVRGGAAAALSGVAFWLISGIWFRHPPEGPSYAWNFLCWTFAYFPGFAALLLMPGLRRN